MILSTLLTTNNIMFAIAVLLVVGIFVYFKLTKPTDAQKAEATEFLNSIKDSLIEIVGRVVDDIDSNKYLDFAEYQAAVVDAIYKECWEFAQRKIAANISNATLSAMVSKLVTEENVRSIVDTILSETKIMDKISTIFSNNITHKLKAIEAEEAEAVSLAAKYEAGEVEEEYAGEHDLSEFEKGRMETVEPEYPEETNIDTEDETVEVVGEYEVPDATVDISSEIVE